MPLLIYFSLGLLGLLVVSILAWWAGNVFVARTWDKYVRRVIILDTYADVLTYSFEHNRCVIANLREDGRWEVEL